MKKLSLIMAGVAAVFGLSSCDDDKEPVYTPPTADTEFILNEPALANELITLTPESTVELTCSQPDYGFSAITIYSAEVSLDENFADFRTIASSGKGTSARMSYKGSDIAVALCELHGWASKDEYVNPGPEKIYFRAIAELNGIEGSRCVSNVVSYNNVQSYYAVLEAGRLFVVGDFGGVGGPDWNMDANAVQDYVNAGQVLNETGPGTGIYTGVVKFHAGVCTFRFYTELGDWGGDNALPSIGANGVDGECTTVNVSSEPIMTPAVPGKGSWQTQADFEGGDVTLMFDMKQMTLTIIGGAAEITVKQYVYMVGNNADWAAPDASNEAVYEAWRLEDSSDSGVYTGTFTLTDLPLDDLYCRFYKELAGWGAAQWSSDASGANVEVTPGVAVPTFEGEGCFQFNGVKGKTISVVLDTNTNSVTFDVVE
ncbi:MAG: SusE domain-containing protein [Duncaniella sp.]|nr:SusE domain-containing protein [Duncaniella sp.]